jgi:DNA polymerase V
VTCRISIFIRTSPFNSQKLQYQRSASFNLSPPTQDTRILITTANRLLTEIFKTGYEYQKCGVQLSHIQSKATHNQLELFDYADDNLLADNTVLMDTIDQINRRFPKMLSIAATGFTQSWQPRTNYVSQHYTTDWDDLALIK